MNRKEKPSLFKSPVFIRVHLSVVGSAERASISVAHARPYGQLVDLDLRIYLLAIAPFCM
jgi:hypothetical protein